MSGNLLVTDAGFSPEDWTGSILTLFGLLAGGGGDTCAFNIAPSDEEVEITGALVARQKMADWAFRADRRAYDHPSRLRL